jgi:DNA-binding transcriptional ArsR family regulator
VFQRLRTGPRSVGDLALGLDVTRSAVSQHLKVLKGARLVVSKAEGTRRLYTVDQRGLAELRQWVDGFWGDSLDAFKHAVEAEAAKERKRR